MSGRIPELKALARAAGASLLTSHDFCVCERWLRECRAAAVALLPDASLLSTLTPPLGFAALVIFAKSTAATPATFGLALEKLDLSSFRS